MLDDGAFEIPDSFDADDIDIFAELGVSGNNQITSANEVKKQQNENLAILKGRVDGLEAQQNELEAGGFSDTTTMDGKAIFTLGAVDYTDSEEEATEAAMAWYSYTLNLNTSFTGDDNLYVRLKSGNASDWAKTKTYGTYLSLSLIHISEPTRLR